MVIDEMLRGLRQAWATAGHGWKCNYVEMISLGYTDDILNVSRGTESLEVMIDDCCDADAFAQASFSQWSSAALLDGDFLHVRGTSILRERVLEF